MKKKKRLKQQIKNNTHNTPNSSRANLIDWLKSNYLILIGFFALIFVVFFNSLNNQFLSDDIDGIVNNYQIRNFSYIFTTPLSWVQNSLYFVTEILFGKNPTAYRIINTLSFHLANVVLLFVLLNKLHNRLVAIIASSIFAIHPIIAEPVVWISAGSYPRSTFYILISILLFIISNGRLMYILTAIISFVVGLVSSEKIIMFPIVLFIFLKVYKITNIQYKKIFLYLIVPFLILLPIFFKGFSSRVYTLSNTYQNDTVMINPLLQIPIAISSYISLYLWPDKLTLYHSEMIFTTWQYIFALAIFLSFISAIIIFWKKNKQVSFWLLWFLLFLLPTLNPFGISWIVAERYVYTAIIGIIVVTAIFIDKLAQKEDRKYLVISLFCIWITILSIRTIIRNNDWDNQDNLWLSAARTSPSSPQNHNNLGDYYGRQGDIETAINEFQTAIKLKPNYADAWHNLGNTYIQVKQLDKAIEALENATKFNPNLWQSYQLLAAVNMEQKNYHKAIENMDLAIKIMPNLTSLWSNRAIIYLASGEKLNAEQDLKKALELDPSNQQAKAIMMEISK